MDKTIDRWTDPDGNGYAFKDTVARAQNRATIDKMNAETADRKSELDIERKRIDNLIKELPATAGEYKQSKLVLHSYGNTAVKCTTTSRNYTNVPAFTTDQGGALSSLYTKKSNYQIAVNKAGLYLFELRAHVNSLTANKRVELAPFVNDERNAALASSYNTAGSFTLTKIVTLSIWLNANDTIDFRIAPVDAAEVSVELGDVLVYAIDWDDKFKIPDYTGYANETKDLRVGADGTTYDTAGQAMREQIGSIKEDIDNFPFQLIKSKNEFNSESVDNQDGKSLSDVGAVIDDSNYSVSHKIKCQYGDTVYLSRRISDISDERQFVTVWNICAYDSSDKFLGISTKGSYAVPPNTDHVRFNYWTTLAKTRKIMLSLNSDITYEEYFSPYHIVEKSAIDNPVKELFKDDGIIVDRKIIMPLYGLYVMQGKSVPVFFDNIIMHGQAKNLNVFQSAKGNFLDNGVFQKSLETLEKGFYQNYVIANSSYNTLLKKNDDVVNNSRLTVVDTNAGNGVTRKVLVIGDSLTAANVWTDKLIDLFADDVMNIEMLGTRGTLKAPNEGRGGWRAWNYAFEKDASNDGLSSSVTNPFFNPVSNKFDFSYYMNQQNYTSVDYILLCLGTNDVSRSTHNADDDILLAWKTIIDSIKAFDNNIKILIWLLPMPCGLTNEQPKKDTFLHTKELLINKYDNVESRQTNKIYLVDVGCSVSPTDDFNYKEELISEYGEEKWKRPTDIIHLANKGYYAIAKNIHAGIKAIESGVITN